MLNPEIYQEQSIRLAKRYLKKNEKDGVNIRLSPLCDFITWADCLGNEKIKLLVDKKNISFKIIYLYFKEIFFIKDSFNVYKKFNFINQKFKNVVFSYCEKKNFDKSGKFHDNIFNCSAHQRNTFWFLISLDGYLPKNIKKNIILIYKKKNYFNPFPNIRFFFKNLLRKNFFHTYNSVFYHSKLICNIFNKIFQNKKFKLFIAFENKPHQNAIIDTTKKINSNNNISGFLAPLPWSFQIDMIYKKNKIDKLFVSSKFQKESLVNKYNWPKKKISIINSFRYTKLKKIYNTIFIPFHFNKFQSGIFIEQLNYLSLNTTLLNNKFKVSIHPNKKNQKEHLNLKDKINSIIKKSSKNKSMKKPPIVLGSTGSVISECLQSNGNVVHVPVSIFDNCTRVFSENLILKKISKNIFLYKMKKKMKFVNLNKKKNSFNLLLN